MSQKVRVLLLESVTGLGEAGNIVAVAEGYARNFLFPHGKAALADDVATKRAATKQARATRANEQRLAALQATAESLSSTELVIQAQAKDGDEIFGSIPASRLAKELLNQASVSVAASDVLLPEPIRRLGTYDVTIRLAPDVEADLKVTVASEPPRQPDAEA